MSEQGLLIETKSASLETMAVTIQALHVNGKQMTLAVFRQLPIIDANRQWARSQPGYSFCAGYYPLEYWGVVRYEPKARGADSWLVVSHGGRLFRAPLWPKPDPMRIQAWDGERAAAKDDEALIDSLPQLFIAV